MPDPQYQSSVDVKLDYIQRDIATIKVDVNSIKNDSVSRRELGEALKDIAEKIDPLKKGLESTTKLASETLINYKLDKAKIWVAMAIMLFLGGTIITLSIMAINSKIKTAVSDALSVYDIKGR